MVVRFQSQSPYAQRLFVLTNTRYNSRGKEAISVKTFYTNVGLVESEAELLEFVIVGNVTALIPLYPVSLQPFPGLNQQQFLITDQGNNRPQAWHTCGSAVITQ